MGGAASSSSRSKSSDGAPLNGGQAADGAVKDSANPDETPIEVFNQHDSVEQDNRKANAAGSVKKSNGVDSTKANSAGSSASASHKAKQGKSGKQQSSRSPANGTGAPNPSPQPASKANSKAEIARSAKKIAHRDFDDDDVELIDEGIADRQHTFKNTNNLSVRATHSTEVQDNDGDEDDDSEELNSNRNRSDGSQQKSSVDQYGNRQYDEEFEKGGQTQLLGKKNFFERNFAAESENAQLFVALARDQIQEVKKEQKKEQRREKKKEKEKEKDKDNREKETLNVAIHSDGDTDSGNNSLKASKRDKKKKKKQQQQAAEQEGAGIGIPYD